MGEHRPDDRYRNMQLSNLIKRKELECESINKDNVKIYQRIQGRKPVISFQSLQDEYRQNRLYKEKIERFKVNGEHLVFNEYLVNEEGRYRLPKSTFTKISEVKPIIKFDKDKSMEATFKNAYKSQRKLSKTESQNSKCGSSKSSREKFPFKLMKNSSDKNVFFQVKNVAPLSRNSSSQGLRAKKLNEFISRGSEVGIQRPATKQGK